MNEDDRDGRQLQKSRKEAIHSCENNSYLDPYRAPTGLTDPFLAPHKAVRFILCKCLSEVLILRYLKALALP